MCWLRLGTPILFLIIKFRSRPDLIDPALLRPGRLDKTLFCDLPNVSECMEVGDNHFHMDIQISGKRLFNLSHGSFRLRFAIVIFEKLLKSISSITPGLISKLFCIMRTWSLFMK